MTTLYLVCCSIRSGSRLVQMLLHDAGLGNAREYLHGNQPNFDQYIQYARRIRNGNKRGEVMGWRIMWGHLWGEQKKVPQVWGNVPIDKMLDGMIAAINADSTKYIYLYRRDHLRQAVSAVRAQTVRRWYCPPDQDEPVADIKFNQANIERVNYLVAEFPKYARMWREYFSERGIQPLELVYEDMTASDETIKDTFWRMVEYLEVDAPDGYEVMIPLKKQAGEDVERWIRQYKKAGYDG